MLINFINFLKFLASKDALKSYLNYSDAAMIDFTIRANMPAMFWMNTFVWAATEEGHEYWKNLEEEFLQSLEKKDQEN